MKLKCAFTLTELLAVISIIVLLLAMLMPSLARARLRAKIVVVNAELSDIGLALEAYAFENLGNYPPTRMDCNPDARPHMYALPMELVENGYMPGAKTGDIIYSKVEDKFNPGFAYKYIAVGRKLYYTGGMTIQRLGIPDGFPDREGKTYKWHKDPKTSPVTWVLFSLGPKFDENNWSQDCFPVSKEFWYSPKTKSGIITRLRLKDKIQHIGTFNRH